LQGAKRRGEDLENGRQDRRYPKRGRNKHNKTEAETPDRRGIVFKPTGQQGNSWTAMLPECLNDQVIKYVHQSLGHAGVDKCIQEINQSFYVCLRSSVRQKDLPRMLPSGKISSSLANRVHTNHSVSGSTGHTTFMDSESSHVCLLRH
jgi:hypothetical protein